MLSEFPSSLFHAVARLVIALALAAVVAGCASSTAAPKPGDTLPASDVDPARIPGLAHVHGLGVNPDDGALHAATHFGLWRIDSSGTARRVGEFAHDFMGFSVVGRDHFLASGHPNGARELPPHLGLIESTDAGRSWRSVSRMGESDFHVLRSGARRTYGWSSTSGRLAVTTDRRSWTDRGEMALVDLALDPDDDGQLIAAVAESETRVALRASDDAGKSWSDVRDAPELVRLDWPSDDTAWGVGADGTVFRRSTDGNDWSRRGTLPPPVQAIASHGGQWYAAAGEAIHRSTDEGRRWQVVVQYDD